MSMRLVSSDSHVQEPPELWIERLPADLRERGPKVIAEESGDFWWVDGLRACSFVGGTQVGKRFEAPLELKVTGRFEDVRPATYIAAGYVEDNTLDNVEGCVLYPTAGLLFFGVADSQVFSAICRAYNDWMVDFVSYDPARLKGVAMINLDDVDEGIAELRRSRENGLAGALLATYPNPDRSYDRLEYEPLWAAAQDMAIPLSFHLGTNRSGLATPGEFQHMPISTIVTSDYWVRRSLADIIMTGVFERYPRLRVGSVENALGWAPHFLDRMDNQYSQRPQHEGWARFKDPSALPSDFFRQNVFMSFQDDKRGLAERHDIGIDGLMWGSDYPHTESTFPRSATVLEEMFDSLDVDSKERQLIAHDNACRLYGFDADKIALPA
jgi:predicted TIM-barrel fold metal-dependent hydrolase